MGRIVKPGEAPDMRTLDDLEPPRGLPAADTMFPQDAYGLRAGGGWAMYPPDVRPNAWRRFWAWFLLGWKWEKRL